MKYAITAAALAALAWGAPLSAQAAGRGSMEVFDFSITVPVNVSAIPPNITQLAIQCDVMPENYGDATNQIAHGVMNATLPAHALHRDLVVRFNAAPGRDPALARWYRCSMSFLGTDRGRSVIFFQNGVSSSLVFPLAPGAPVNIGDAGKWIRIPGVSH